MADYMNMELLKFLLFEVHKVQQLFQADRYSDYDKDSVSILLDSAKDWSDKEMFPFFREMDEKPVKWEDGKIIAHPQLAKVLKYAAENGWLGACFDYDQGGSQMPFTVLHALNHIYESANNHVPGYVGLTSGAADLIRTFGSKELFETYGPKMVSGDWGGTMCLTEPQAGSSLSDIVTSAKLQENGSYRISGQKIFISGGDHQFCENFIHLTLVRIEGAPKGTKGISLMVVPKMRIEENGALIDNDVYTAADFEKLGQRGYATTHLVFGENDNCYGWLVGEENKGLKYMFQMMNGARLDVGLTAVSTATAAYYASLQYAKERPQGRLIREDGKKNIEASQTLIINHPDVKRMLLFQKAIIEGSLSLLLECTIYEDIQRTQTGAQAEEAHDLLELLTPIAKTYPSDKGIESISNGLQVLGGYGYCMDFPLQQYYRDIRIMSLYEGTSGIQSLDLLGRKVTMKGGKAMQLLFVKISEVIREANTFDGLKPFASKLSESLEETTEIMNHLMGYAGKGEFQKYLADATLFMNFAGTIVIAYQWLKMANVAAKELKKEQKAYSDEFYESKIHTMKYFFIYELPKTKSWKETLMSEYFLTLENNHQKMFS